MHYRLEKQWKEQPHSELIQTKQSIDLETIQQFDQSECLCFLSFQLSKLLSKSLAKINF